VRSPTRNGTFWARPSEGLTVPASVSRWSGRMVKQAHGGRPLTWRRSDNQDRVSLRLSNDYWLGVRSIEARKTLLRLELYRDEALHLFRESDNTAQSDLRQLLHSPVKLIVLRSESWCYSQNSRPMPKKGQKAHSNIHSYIPIVEKAHWLFQLTIQELHNYQIPASSWQYLQCYSHNGVYMSKTRKKRTQMPIQMPQLWPKRTYGTVCYY